jgi:hypothetical protein
MQQRGRHPGQGARMERLCGYETNLRSLLQQLQALLPS